MRQVCGDAGRRTRSWPRSRDWLAAHVPAGPLPSVDTAEGFERHREWERALAAARLSVVSWPAAYGGRDASLLDWLAFEEEYYAAGAPVRVGQNGLFLLAPTLFAHGTQRAARPAAAADGPGGRDLGAGLVRAGRGQRPGRHPVPRGRDRRRLAAVGHQDVELARGLRRPRVRAVPHRHRRARAAHGGGTRRDRHRGLTYLLFGLRDPGVTVRPIRQLGGETGFAEIFLDDVFVPDANVVGAPGDGWRIAMSTASHERGLSLRSPGRFLAAAGRLVELWRRAGDPADTAMAHRVADAWIGARAYQLHTQADRRAAGRGRDARGRGEHGQGVLVRARHRAARDRA